MSELTVSQLIKIIIGIFVFVAVVGGVYLFFKNNFLDFIHNLPGGNSTKLFLGLLEI
ncbi:hypothetical protein J4474_00145 [Candidatus Pacearchaeota archaeon]|nr:hypothetical protein [Candidatus Pacearchaeota archaeon]